MITNDRLDEFVETPRIAFITKEEAKELAAAYRLVSSGVTVTTSDDGVWLSITSPSGKHALIEMEALGVARGGLVGAAILEWVDSMKTKGTKA